MIEFPTAPANGTRVTAPDGMQWTWNGVTWELVGSGGGSGGGYVPPAGIISDFIGTVAPAGTLGMIGQTIVDGQTLHPNLWLVLPASMKSGTSILMPDTRGRMTVGLNPADALFDAIGDTGGSKDAVVVSHLHTGDAHTHAIDPPNTASSPNIPVLINGNSNFGVALDGGGSGWNVSNLTTDIAPFTSGGASAANTGTTGVAATNANLPPFITFMKIITAS